MTLTIREAFDLPSADEIHALGFVVRLEGAGAGAGAGAAGIVESYVITPHLQQELPRLFSKLRGSIERGEEMGWFIHGSFGSGKSHFLSYLGLLLEGDGTAWQKDHVIVRQLKKEHGAWVEKAGLLVVRLHMLSASRRTEGFDRVIYRAFNRALERRGKPQFSYLNVDGVLDLARREAEQYGESFWEKLRAGGIASSADHFERRAKGSPDQREQLVRQFAEFKGLDPETMGVDPDWATGLQRMAAHARDHGFGGIVLLVDEMLLWLGEKARAEFVAAINQLNTIVDYGKDGGGKRAVPIGVLVARQRRLSDFFPDLVSEDHVQEYLDHHGGRFELLELEDVELRYVCKERVLKRRRPTEVEAALGTLVEQHKKIIPELIRNAADGEAYLRDVYPFHPALIEMLIDISTLMQRERTALRLLYELLVVHYPDLELGKFLPVGSAFEAVFPESGVEGTRRVDELRAIHRLYYLRFKPAIEQLARPDDEGGTGLTPIRRKVLDQLAKTVLLAEVSPRLKGSVGLTVERLIRLNDADVSGETLRGKIAGAYRDLVDLSRLVPDLQVTGDGATATVRVVLQGADFGQLLSEARSKVENSPQRFKTFYAVLKDELGLAGRRGFGEGELEGEVTVTWRGTKRRGSVKIANIRELMNKQFKVRDGEEFRLILDYPWDEPGHTVAEDRQRASDVRRREGSSVTMCWLPRHLTGEEAKVITDLSAAQFILSDEGQDKLLARLSTVDRQQVLTRARAHAESMEKRLRDLLREVYKDDGQAVALLSDVPTTVPEADLDRNLDRFAQLLLDRQHPTHPSFDRLEPKAEALRTLCRLMVTATDDPSLMVAFEDSSEELEVLRHLGQPLEVVDPPGHSRARLRIDTRYIKLVLDAAEGGTVSWNDVDRRLEEEHGLQPAVRNLFLCYLLQARSFRARNAAGDVVQVELDGKAKTGLTLERAPVVDTPSWSRARELGEALFDISPKDVGDHRSLQAQDRLAGLLRQAGAERRGKIQSLHKRLVELHGSEVKDDDRRRELRAAQDRLAPLVKPGTESHVLLSELAAAWPDDAGDPLRAVVRDLARMADALDALSTSDRNLLLRGRTSHGERVEPLLGELEELLSTSESARPLRRSDVESWNAKAHDLASMLISHPTPPPQPIPKASPPEAKPAPAEEVLARLSTTVHPHDGDELGEFLGALRKQLKGLDPDEVQVEVVITPAVKSKAGTA